MYVSKAKRGVYENLLKNQGNKKNNFIPNENKICNKNISTNL